MSTNLLSLPSDRDFYFEPAQQPKLSLFDHLVTHDTKGILVQNKSNSPVQIPRKLKLGMVTEVPLDDCFNATIETDSAVVPPSNPSEPKRLAATDKNDTLGEKDAVTIPFVRGRNLPGTEADSYLGPRPEQDTRAEPEPTRGLVKQLRSYTRELVKQLCSSIRGLVKQLRLYIQHCLRRLALQTRRHTPYGSRQPIYSPSLWPLINEAVEVFSLLRGDYHGKWLEDVDVTALSPGLG